MDVEIVDTYKPVLRSSVCKFAYVAIKDQI